MVEEKLIIAATLQKTLVKSRRKYKRINIPSWVFDFYEIDASESCTFVWYAREGDKEVRLRPATLEERMAAPHVDLYMSGLWPLEITEEQKETFLELEEFHKLNPSRVYNNKIMEFPFSRLTEKENEVYANLPDDEAFTSKKIGLSLSSTVAFIKKLLELGMAEELPSEQTEKRGRPLKRYKKRNDFDREVPWELVGAAKKHEW